MVRLSQQIHAPHSPVEAKRAATLLLLRDAANGLEVLMTRRATAASFAPGAYVFPGGAVEDADALCHAQSTRRPTQVDAQLTDAIAAIRESFEELGVLLARHTGGQWATAEDIAAMDRSVSAALPLADQCAARGLTLAGAEVFVLAHWITDRDLPKRFDVPFLVARMPADQTAVADEREQFEPCWISPAQALMRHEAGDFLMIFPTLRTLERLLRFDTVDAVLAACAGEAPLWTSCPRAGWLAGVEARFMESGAPFGELALVCPDGQLAHTLDWQTTAPVRLLKNVMRLTAPNPGVMTGPGTNSYLVGDATTGYTVIDPGPNDADHLQRLHDAAGGHIRTIVCTHSHPDHSPGAQPLQAMCNPQPPILGLPSGPNARADSQFMPDRTLQNNELLGQLKPGLAADLIQKDDVQVVFHTLKVIHTPGHAANHLCLVLVEDGLLFSGDHILNGSTTVINPPDGAMTAYLDSLDVLSAACIEHAIDFILPAHGYVLGTASQSIAHLKAHRLKREVKIAAVMQAMPQGTLDDWLPLAYDDVDARLWPVARRSLLAHAERLGHIAPTPPMP